jgi:hypothetical protein
LNLTDFVTFQIGAVVSQSISPDAMEALTKLFISANIPQPFLA